MARPAWYAYTGILNRQLSEETEVISTRYDVVDRRLGRVVAQFDTASDAFIYTRSQGVPSSLFEVEQNVVTSTNPASQRGVALVPLHPLPIFRTGGTVLATRGFWDVASKTVPSGIVSTFAFGLTFLPVKTVFERVTDPQFPFVLGYRQVDIPSIPDPLLDDVRWFCYDSFVRVTTDVNQDPPFYSKSKRKFSANECLCAVAAVEVQVGSLQSLTLSVGLRFRVLIQS